MKIKYLLISSFLMFNFWGCNNSSKKGKMKDLPHVNWGKRRGIPPTTNTKGASYLSVYSEIYSKKEINTYDLATTISIRNINKKDTVYITQANYFDTMGGLIKNYVTSPVYVAPMETLEIVLLPRDISGNTGGTGGNIVFDWSIPEKAKAPLFEAVMISVYGQQGLSFRTEGVRVE